MSWKDRAYAGVGKWLRSKGIDAVEILDIEEFAGYEYDIDTVITYKDRLKGIKTYTHKRPLVDIIDQAG